MRGVAYLSMVDKDLEEGVHQQDSVWQDAAAVQQHRLKPQHSLSQSYHTTSSTT